MRLTRVLTIALVSAYNLFACIVGTTTALWAYALTGVGRGNSTADHVLKYVLKLCAGRESQDHNQGQKKNRCSFDKFFHSVSPIIVILKYFLILSIT